MSRLDLTFLGAIQARLDGQSITDFESDRVRALLAYLAVEADRPHRRDALAALIWPDWPDRSARTNLRNALANLRGAIGDREAEPPFLLITRETIRFNQDSDYQLDVTAFSELVERDDPEAWEQAITIYQGGFLEGFQLKDSSSFEDWHLLTRERLQRQSSITLRRLADDYERQGDYERASEYARLQVELEPWYEEGHQQLMRLLVLNGQRSAALTQYDICRRQLAFELGVEPSQETVRLYEQIRDGEMAITVQEIALAPAPGTPPYKGLEYFDEEDADLFYGRERLINKLLAQLDPSRSNRFLAVVGASGSGKSSIVRAGLIPALRRDKAQIGGDSADVGSKSGPIIVITPSVHPLETLAIALTPTDAPLSTTVDLIDHFKRDPRSLHLQICRILPKAAKHFVLMVDQFEELFTQCDDPVERQAFVDNLLTAAAESGPSIVVITLRADFYAHCGEYTALREALEQNQVFIGPMNEAELRQAVAEPAEQNSWTFEPGLIDLLLQEVSDEPGALPLLSHALLETWQRRSGRMMTLAGYSESGGVRGAIAKTAERVLQSQTLDQQAITRTIFLRLTELGEGTQETRRRARLSELSPRPEDAEAIDDVLATLVAARLVTTSQDSAEVAHEALIREWPTLRGWLEEDREGLQLQRHLTDAALEWERLGRDPGELYRGARLIMASEWAELHGEELNVLEHAFLQTSLAQAEKREEEREVQRQRELETAQTMVEVERERAAEQTRSAQRLRRGALVLAGVATIAVVLAIFAFSAQSTAQREATINRSLVLAAQAVEADEAGEVDRALALGLEAVSIDDPPPDAISKLASVANGMGTRAVLTGHHGAAFAGAFSPNGSQAISGGCEQPDDAGECPAGELIMWDMATMAETRRWTGHDAWVTALAWSPTGDFILSGGEDGSIILWDVANQDELARWDAHDGFINAVAISPDGKSATTAGADGTVILLDLDSRQILQRLQGHSDAVLDVAFSPNGHQVLSGSADASIILWDVLSGDLMRTYTGHASDVVGVAFLPLGEQILSASIDFTLRLWDMASGEELQRRDMGDNPEVMALSPNNDTAFHSSEWLIYTWDLNQWNAPHRKLFGHEGSIQEMVISDDGRLALSVDDLGVLRIWNMSGSDDIKQMPVGYPATGLAIAPSGQQAAIGAWGGDDVIWDLASAKPIHVLEGGTGIVAPGGMTFSQDGRWVAASSGDYDQDTEEASLLVWDAETGDIHCNLQGHARRARTISFSPDSRTALSGSQGKDDIGDLILWNIDDCSLIRRFDTGQDTTGIDFSDDGRYAFTSSAFAGNATLWDVETGQPVRVFPMPGEVFLDAAFGPGDETVLVAALSGVIIEWDRETGEEIRRLTGHDGGVWSVALSPDEQRLVSSDDTGTVILWDMATGRELRRHNAHNALSFQAAFSPDNATVYSVSTDGTLVVWQTGDTSINALLSWIEENRYVRDLTCEERVAYQIEPLCDSP